MPSEDELNIVCAFLFTNASTAESRKTSVCHSNISVTSNWLLHTLCHNRCQGNGSQVIKKSGQEFLIMS